MYWKLKFHLNKLSSRTAKKGTCWSISCPTYYTYIIREITCIDFYFWYLHITSLGGEDHVNYNCQWKGNIRILRRGGGQVNFIVIHVQSRSSLEKCNNLFHFVKGLFRWTIFQRYTKKHIALLSKSLNWYS